MTLLLVTGAAGFIGSRTVDLALKVGYDVRGVDCFTDYYDPDIKRRNIAAACSSSSFELQEVDLSGDPLEGVMDGVDLVIHLAAQAGVRASWSNGFGGYLWSNVFATQRLLEACLTRPVERFVYASSSSVYGNASSYPTLESDLPRPHSPYGVTKLAGEHLCVAYAANWGIPTVALRYFTVYGPRQRPDMAINRLIGAALTQQPFMMFGSASKVRDFTFVDDIVAANLAAMSCDVGPGFVANVAGGSSASMAEVIRLVEEAVGVPVPLESGPAAAGDVERTGGATDRLRGAVGWLPATALPEGIARQAAWQRDMLR